MRSHSFFVIVELKYRQKIIIFFVKWNWTLHLIETPVKTGSFARIVFPSCNDKKDRICIKSLDLKTTAYKLRWKNPIQDEIRLSSDIRSRRTRIESSRIWKLQGSSQVQAIEIIIRAKLKQPVYICTTEHTATGYSNESKKKKEQKRRAGTIRSPTNGRMPAKLQAKPLRLPRFSLCPSIHIYRIHRWRVSSWMRAAAVAVARPQAGVIMYACRTLYLVYKAYTHL